MSDTPGQCNLTPPPPAGPGFVQELANATGTFSGTTGFDLSAIMVWAGPNLLGLYLGNTLAIIYGFRGWTVAATVIAAMILFSYRAFRFFRH